MLQLKNKSKFLLVFLLVVSSIGLLKAGGENLSWWDRLKNKVPSWATVKRYAVPVGIGAVGVLEQGLKRPYHSFYTNDMQKQLATISGGNYDRYEHLRTIVSMIYHAFATGDSDELNRLKKELAAHKRLAAQSNKPRFKDVTLLKPFGNFAAGIEARVKYEGLRLFKYYRPLILSALAIGAYKLALDYWDKYQQQIKETVEEADKKKEEVIE